MVIGATEAYKVDKRLIRLLRRILGKERVLFTKPSRYLYGYDASLEQGLPHVVVFPASTQQVSEVVKLAQRYRVPFLARGSGTNLSGGSIPIKGGIVLELSKMNRILEIDPVKGRAVVEPGVYNLDLQQALVPHGYLYAPDPASQGVSTLGGNVGENSGGPHCLKYGVTTNHILGLEVVLPDGDIVQLGNDGLDLAGYDLRGLLVGSEGTLGIVTKVTVRIIRQPQSVRTLLAVFNNVEDASRAVSDIISKGLIPAALEMMDRVVIEAVEASVGVGYPLDAGAVLIIELDGLEAGMDRQASRVKEICKLHGARDIKAAVTPGERALLWSGRRGAFGAIARVRPSYLVADGIVPRTRLPEALKRVAEIAERYSLLIGNVFHAGDGNLHPLILFDDRDKAERKKVMRAGREILGACVELGGTISGEHGIGLEKIESMSLIYNFQEIGAMQKVKMAFDPGGLCNPGKIIPPCESLAPESPKVADGKIKCHTLQAPAEVEPFMVDSKSPERVFFPEKVEEICELLAMANAKGKSVFPRGGGTKMGLGYVPERVAWLLSLTCLDRVLDYDPANLTVTAQAGVVLTDLQDLLRARGQFLPLDPPCPSCATLGGTVATNFSGPQAFAFGSPRDLILGMKLVLAGGEIIRVGGKTVKNVSGYDLAKLFVGSLGTLGIIVEVTCRLFPLPEKGCTIVATFPDAAKVTEVSRKLLDSALLPTTLEVLNPEAAAELSRRANLAFPPNSYVLLTSLSGDSEAVAWQSLKAQDLLAEAKANLLLELEGKRAQQEVWSFTVDFPNIKGYHNPERIICRADTLPTEIGSLIEEAERLAEIHAGGFSILSSVGRGTAYLHLIASHKTDNPVELLKELAFFVRRRLGGNLLVLSAPPGVKEGLDVWGESSATREELGLMRRLKDQFDPNRILNPGRFVGGI